MRVVGIDPGIAITGWAAVEVTGGQHKLLQAGCITTPAGMATGTRLLHLRDGLSEILTEYQPSIVALENLFFNTNAKTALIVGQARGVVMITIEDHHIPLTEYTPLQVKMALTGYGRADKNQIQQMVKQILKQKEIIKQDDTADAVAIALTHCFSYKLGERVKGKG